MNIDRVERPKPLEHWLPEHRRGQQSVSPNIFLWRDFSERLLSSHHRSHRGHRGDLCCRRLRAGSADRPAQIQRKQGSIEATTWVKTDRATHIAPQI